MPSSRGDHGGSGPGRGSEEAESSAMAVRRAAPIPITAGAFSFNLAATPAAAKKAQQGATSSRKTSMAPSFTSHKTTQTPQRSILHALDSLPSPLQFRRDATPKPGATGTHRLGSVLDEVSPFRSKTPMRSKDGDVSLGQLPGAESMTIQVAKRKREDEIMEIEEEGIGVSPRKSKDVRWANKGESSLILFYSSLERRMAMPRSPATSRKDMMSSARSKLGLELETLVRSAALILLPLSAVGGPTHQAIIVKCQLKGRDNADTHPPAVESSMQSNEEINGSNQLLYVVFQALPAGCPRLGLDQRVMAGKLQEQGGWSGVIGVWPPWTERDLVLYDEHHELPDIASEEGTEKRNVRVIFASRYLIVDDRQVVK
ncbi:hypothetical protein BD324DRAFT_609088 [Kockovaella imperatae]|uniref:Uncharacterized protein n=1 Tax=Kockovaella imperatae TaxID=4999 RepID=A0A1Y1UEH6_9TREE|nr:hypothetical protein BD324DRAFT_609088 [Kockovaella imperatae]ORX36461.1 hypothetical protein BD324DRAFT_609088 [Kockovaella imperatae]